MACFSPKFKTLALTVVEVYGMLEEPLWLLHTLLVVRAVAGHDYASSHTQPYALAQDLSSMDCALRLCCLLCELLPFLCFMKSKAFCQELNACIGCTLPCRFNGDAGSKHLLDIWCIHTT